VTRHYITIAEAAEYLQISDRTVRRLIGDGELTGYRMDRSRPINEPPRTWKRRP
jgi:excisionase family DNA binding protein